MTILKRIFLSHINSPYSTTITPTTNTSSTIIDFVLATATSTSLPTSTPTSIPEDDYCRDLDFFVKLLLLITGDCELGITRKQLIKDLEPVSKYSSYLSITAWLFAQLPQVIKNYSDKSVDGLSLGFLACWFMGDFLNFTSCLLTDAMAFQLLLSTYYLIIDLILGVQYYYYSAMYHNPHSRFYHKNKSRKLKQLKSPRSALRDTLIHHAETMEAAEAAINEGRIVREHIGPISISPEYKKTNKGSKMKKKRSKKNVVAMVDTAQASDSDSGDASTETDSNKGDGIFRQNNNSITKLISSSFIVGFSKVQGLPITTEFATSGSINNSAIFKIIHSILTMSQSTLGKVLAWSCTSLYLSSRIPQIITNYKAHSTSGISMKLILFALLGNLFYSISLITCKASLVGGKVSQEFWNAELSYLIGALGTVLFDSIVILQWYHWDHKKTYRGNGEIYSVIGGNREGGFLLNSASVANYGSTNNNANGSHSALSGKMKSPILITKNIGINNGSKGSYPSSPVNFKTSLSPNHARKLSEFTPLSPIDFLLDDYMATAQSYKIPAGISNNIHATDAATTASVNTNNLTTNHGSSLLVSATKNNLKLSKLSSSIANTNTVSSENSSSSISNEKIAREMKGGKCPSNSTSTSSSIPPRMEKKSSSESNSVKNKVGTNVTGRNNDSDDDQEDYHDHDSDDEYFFKTESIRNGLTSRTSSALAMSFSNQLGNQLGLSSYIPVNQVIETGSQQSSFQNMHNLITGGNGSIGAVPMAESTTNSLTEAMLEGRSNSRSSMDSNNGGGKRFVTRRGSQFYNYGSIG